MDSKNLGAKGHTRESDAYKVQAIIFILHSEGGKARLHIMGTSAKGPGLSVSQRVFNAHLQSFILSLFFRDKGALFLLGLGGHLSHENASGKAYKVLLSHAISQILPG